MANQTGTISPVAPFISIPGASENIELVIPYGVQLGSPRVANDGSVRCIIARVEDVLSTTNDPSFNLCAP